MLYIRAVFAGLQGVELLVDAFRNPKTINWLACNSRAFSVHFSTNLCAWSHKLC